MSPERAPLGQLLVVLDEKLSRSKSKLLTSVINRLRIHAQVDVVSAGTSEAQVLEKVQKKKYSLILVPWHHYFKWTKIEGFLGQNRASGPFFAGYTSDPTPYAEALGSHHHSRGVLFDFSSVDAKDAALMVALAALEKKRSGLRPLLGPQPQIYCESWFTDQGMGNRTDIVTSLPEFMESPFVHRGNAIRILLVALWSLVYEDGPGKSDLAQKMAVSSKSPKAYFQVGVSPTAFAIRLCTSMPNWTLNDLLLEFWSGERGAMKASQMLMRNSDFLRIHQIHTTSDLEVTVALFASAKEDRNPMNTRSLWVDPLIPQLIGEAPFEKPSPENKLILLPDVSFKELGHSQNTGDLEATQRALKTSSSQVSELQKKISALEEDLKELRSGGVGTSKPLAPPGPIELLEAFEERFADSQNQIALYEEKVDFLESNGGSEHELLSIRRKISELTRKEKEWIQVVARIIELFKSRKKSHLKKAG